MALLSRVWGMFGGSHSREVRRLAPAAEAINEWEEQSRRLDDEALRGRTAEFVGGGTLVLPASFSGHG